MLIVIFKINLLTVIIIDLFFAAITKTVGALSYVIKNMIAWRIVALMLIWSIPGSIIIS